MLTCKYSNCVGDWPIRPTSLIVKKTTIYLKPVMLTEMFETKNALNPELMLEA